MTFGGLALGIGMVVDAAIVVLENAFRHMEHGKDRVTAAIEGSEEVWSRHRRVDPDAHRGVRAAALPDGHLEHPVQAAVGRRHLLAADVAVRGRHAGAGALLEAARCCRRRSKQRKGLGGTLFTCERERSSKGWTTGTGGSCTRRWRIVRSWSAIGAASVVAAVLMFPLLEYRARAADRRGRGAGDGGARRRARASSAPTPILSRLEQMTQQLVPEATDAHRQRRRRRRRWRRRRFGGGGTSRGIIQLFLVPKDERDAVERADCVRAAPAAVGHPGRHRPRQRERRQQPAQPAAVRAARTTAAAWRSKSAAKTSTTRAAARAGRARTCSRRRRASPTRGSHATKAVPSWPCGSIARRPRCSA